MALRACPNRAAGCKCEACESQRAYQRAWAKAHYDPEKAKAKREPKEVCAKRMREWTRRNRESVRARARANYHKNGRGAEYARRWRAANRDKVNLAVARYRVRHPDATRKWQDTHPESYLAKRARDREARKARGYRTAYRHRLPVATRRAAERFAKMDTCALCFLPIYGGVETRALRYSRDHIVAIANGGTHEESNLQPAHFCCNASKRTRDDVSLFWIRKARARVLAYFRKEVELRRVG